MKPSKPEPDMEGNSKSLWYRPWMGWRGVAGWFVILFAAAFLIFFALSLATEKPGMPTGPIVLGSMVAALAAAVPISLLVVFSRWIRCWRNFRRFLFGLACLATLIALFYAEENIRGKLAWNRYVKEQVARGEVLDLMQLAPAPVPDEQNFFMTPLWDSMHFTSTNGRIAWTMERPTFSKFDISGPRRSNRISPYPRWNVGERLDLSEWQAFYRGSNNLYSSGGKTFTNYFPVSAERQTPAEDVLFALSRFDDNRQLLTEASSRPKARFWVNYEDGFGALLPHLASMKSITRYLSLHSVAASRTGDAKTALKDVILSLRVMESVRDEPFLISHLVRIAMMQITIQALWEGLADNRWSDEQLAAIEAELKPIDFLADYRLTMRGERACCIWNVDYVEKNRRSGAQELLSMGGTEPEKSTFRDVLVFSLIRLAPNGWFDQNKVVLCQTIDDYFQPLANLDQQTVNPAAVKTAITPVWMLYAHRTVRNFASRLLLPAMTGIVQKFAYAQSTIDRARVAIALERYRLAEGKYPESLDALTPRFLAKLPPDVITGEPLKYRRVEDRGFVLYSIGWNEKGNGGMIGLRENGTENSDEGDWVWRYPDSDLQSD